MHTFRTIFPSFQANFSITHQDQVFSVGSCFAEHIGERLTTLKFQTLLNPFGILYNPISIANCLEKLISENYTFLPKDLIHHQGLWHSPNHHSRFSHQDSQTTLEHINQSYSNASAFLKKTNRLILTFGTAEIFIWKATRAIVSNCHKLPQQAFEKRRLRVQEIVDTLIPIFQLLKSKQPEIEIILTVSPIRHIRSGLIENQKSKATLLLAIEQLCKNLDFVHYFPSYEIVLDDLRDYRFFESDMIHPNQIAVDYVWEYFSEAYFRESTKGLVQQIKKIIAASRHIPFHLHSEQHQKFVKKQLSHIYNIVQKYNYLNFEFEETLFKNQLIN